MRNFLITALAAAPLLASCSTYSSWSSNPARIVLAEKAFEDGAKVEYRLVYSSNDDISIHRDSTAILELPFLGVSVSSINQDLAQTHGTTPWVGVVINSVTEKSAADDAGLKAGDILLAINGQSLSSDSQFFEVVQSYEPRVSVDLTIATRDPEGLGRIERLVSVELGSREMDETSTTRIPVESYEEIFNRTGLVVASVPADLAEELYGSEAPAVMIAAVATGSEAYEDGFRGGDRILRCNGADVMGIDPVIEASQPQRDQMELEVKGPLVPHSGTIRIVRDVATTKEFDIPIVLDHSSNVTSTRTSFLDFIFQFGFNYRRRALPAPTTREPQTSSYLSILPLGMFEFTRRPGYRKNRIFWIIRWSNRS